MFEAAVLSVSLSYSVGYTYYKVMFGISNNPG